MDSKGSEHSGSGSWFGALDRLGQIFGTEVDSAPSQPPAVPEAQALAPRVLVVEDNLSLQFLTCRMLAALGTTTTLAANGAEAVSLACSSEFDLILMDVQMPVLDGLGATRKIRRFEQEHGLARVPVVAYTSCVYHGNEPFLLDFGIDAVLEKPSTARTLQECLLSWLPAGRIVGNVRAAGRAAPMQTL